MSASSPRIKPAIGPSATPPKNSSRGIWLAMATLVVALLFAYQNSFSGPFVFDDVPAIVGNPSIRNLAALDKVFTPPAEDGQTVGGRPVVNFTLALNYAIGGPEPRGYHIVNLVIHTLATLTLFGLVRRTLQSPRLAVRFGAVSTPLALAVAGIWSLHPLLTESVTYVVQRTESLMGLFYLLTLYAFVRSAECHVMVDGSARKRSEMAWQGAAVMSCFLGMATKEVMVSAPLIVLLYDRTFFSRTFRAAGSARWKLYASLTATWLLLAYLVHSGGNRGGTAGLGAGDSPWAYALIQCRAITHYLRLAFWPEGLVFDYGMHLAVPFTDAASGAIVLVLLLAATGVALWRWPAPGFLGAWFFAALAPSSSFVPIAVQPMAEHRMYLPLIALIALVAPLVYDRMKKHSWFAFGAAAAVLGALTAARNTDYHSDLSLWDDTAAKHPENARAQCHLGDALLAAGRPADALARYEQAVRLEREAARPGERTLLGDFLVNQGNALVALGNPGEAMGVYRQAIDYDPKQKEAAYNLGWVLMESNRLSEAAEAFEAALKLSPNYSSAHTNLGSVLLREERPAEAIPHFEAALRIEPGAKALSNLGLALTQARRATEAIARLEQALQIDPDFAKAHEFLADVLTAQGRVTEAVAHYERALRLNPADERVRKALQALRGDGSVPR